MNDWIEAFNKVGNTALKTQRDTQTRLLQNSVRSVRFQKRNRSSQYLEEEPQYLHHGPSNDPQTTSYPTNIGTRTDAERQNGPQPKMYTIDEVSCMYVSKLCNGCGWPLEGANHAAACRYEGSP